MITWRQSPSRGHGSAEVAGFHDPVTGSIQYVVSDPASGEAALIDVVLDFDLKAMATGTTCADHILEHVARQGLEVVWVLDTHPHADHLIASSYLREKLGAPTAIGGEIRAIARLWREIYNLPEAFDVEAAFDRLFDDGETFRIGSLPVRVMLSPGHTLASVTYLVGADAAFTHDTLMVPDSGTSRCDFPGGSARTLYRSIQAILALPAATRVFVGHDYCPRGREPLWETTVAEQIAHNIHLQGGTPEDEYIRIRDARDATLALPDRMLYALQVNLRGGRLPPPEADGNCYFKIPANRF